LLLGSAIYARAPGDGSAREQAASCQRVLGGAANFALTYATKRYRSNLINWGLLPFIIEKINEPDLQKGAFVFFPKIIEEIETSREIISAFILPKTGELKKINCTLGSLTLEERQILIKGCLINYYRKT
jgi:aconitate hydratase